jgi:hypothetical protein
MNKPTVLVVAFAATIVIGACSATTVPSVASPSAAPAVAAASAVPPSPAPTVAAPSVAALSPAPTVDAPSVAPQSLVPAAAGQPQTIHVLEYPHHWARVHVGSLSECKGTPCLGDYLVGRSSLSDATTKKTVGTLVTECFIVDAASGEYHCPSVMITLTGRGKIVFSEDPFIGANTASASEDMPIIGGTGEFLGATGSVASPANSTAEYGDFVITIIK